MSLAEAERALQVAKNRLAAAKSNKVSSAEIAKLTKLKNSFETIVSQIKAALENSKK